MKSSLLLTIILFLSGCVTAPIHLYDQQKFNGNPAIITTNIDDSLARQLIKKKFGSASTLNPALIYYVNNNSGNNTFPGARNVFNSSYDTSYEIYVKPGMQKVIVSINHHMVSNKHRIPIKFEAVEGHIYTIKQITDTKLFSDKVHWAPILIDMTSRKILFPEKIQWMDKE